MIDILGWFRRRHRSSELRLRFITDTIDAFDLLHRRVEQIEEQLREQQATTRELESNTARAEAQASVARLEVRDFIKEYTQVHEPHDHGRGEWEAMPKVEPSPELLESLMPILTPIRSKRVTLGRAAGESDSSDEGDEHLCLLPTPDGYELLERPGGAPPAGSIVDLGDGWQGQVVKVARSPLPDDRRRCAYLQQAAAAAPDEEVLSPVLVGSSE